MSFKKLILTSSIAALLSQGVAFAARKNTSTFWPFYKKALEAEKLNNKLEAVQEYTKALEFSHNNPAILSKLGFMYLNSEAEGDLRIHATQKAAEFFTKAVSADPKDPIPTVMLAKAYQQLGEFDKSAKYYSRAISLEPNNTLLKYNLAVLNFEAKDYRSAIEQFNKIIMAYPDNLKARSYLGAALQATDNYLAAIEQYNYVLDYEPNNFSLHKNMGDSWLALDKLEEAKLSYQAALKADDNVPELYTNLAYIATKSDQNQAAIDNLNKAIELKANPEWKLALAHAYWANSDLDEAVEEFEKLKEFNLAAYIYQLQEQNDKAIMAYQKAIETNPKDHKSRFNLARLYHLGENYTKAKETYISLLEHKPNDIEVQYLLASIDQEQGNIKEAIKAYDEILATGEKDSKLNSKIKQNLHYNLALAHKSNQDLKSAEKNFEHVVKAGTNDFEQKLALYKELSFIKISLDKDIEAEKLINDWLRDDPTSIEARNLYADFLIHNANKRKAVEQLRLAAVLDKTASSRLKLANLLHSQNNLYDALAEFQVVLKKEPKNLHALVGAANNFKALGLQTEAEEIYQKALNNYPDDLISNYNYGLLLQSSGKSADAIKHFEKVLQINPNYTENYYLLGMAYWDLNQKDQARTMFDTFIHNSRDEKLKAHIRSLINTSAAQEEPQDHQVEPRLEPGKKLDDQTTTLILNRTNEYSIG